MIYNKDQSLNSVLKKFRLSRERKLECSQVIDVNLNISDLVGFYWVIFRSHIAFF